MPYTEILQRKGVSREEMMKRVARFNELKGSDGGLADSRHPLAERILYNAIGFQPPPSEAGAIGSPVGEEAARNAAIRISEGFNLGFCRAKPGKGPLMHNHDTNETFIAITGRWRGSWIDDQGVEQHVDLDPLDIVSFPPGVIRRFLNVSEGNPDEYSIIMFVIAGDAPSAEYTSDVYAELERMGLV